MVGKNDERFVNIHCLKCSENFFFQIPALLKNIYSLEEIPENRKDDQIITLQKEWNEWLNWKKRHLNKPNAGKSPLSKSAQWMFVFLLCGITMFFIFERWYLLDPILENPLARQAQIVEYKQHLLEVPCLPSNMKVKIRTVPIHYTRERPVHQNLIQYGEAGIYWGEEHIKIHRSNFWFFGWPKNSQLLNTLVHELRHRTSPSLGHNSEFFELVERDTKCVLKHWPSLNL